MLWRRSSQFRPRPAGTRANVLLRLATRLSVQTCDCSTDANKPCCTSFSADLWLQHVCYQALLHVFQCRLVAAARMLTGLATRLSVQTYGCSTDTNRPSQILTLHTLLRWQSACGRYPGQTSHRENYAQVIWKSVAHTRNTEVLCTRNQQPKFAHLYSPIKMNA